MIDIVKKFFGKTKQNDPKAKTGPPRRDIRIATCALLLEMSNIDGEFSESEKEKILFIIKEHYALSEDHATELLKASNLELEQSIDLWRFARLINQNYTTEEKTRIIEMVWHIAYADGDLNKHEDYLMHKMAKLLRLSHKQLIDAKLKAKQTSSQ